MVALSNAERQARYRANHLPLARKRHIDYMRKARKDGKIPYNEFYTFKNNPILGQKLARELYFGEGQSELRSNLEKLGVQLQVNQGKLPYLELRHSCTEQCSFFGHTESWIDIEPVAYKIHFVNSTMSQEESEWITKIVKTEHGERWITTENPSAKRSFWIFKRYLKKERKLDFPVVQPVFECKNCNVRETLPNLEALFLQPKHVCPLPIDPLDKVRYFWIHGSIEAKAFTSSLRQLHAFLGKYHSTTGYKFYFGDY